MKPYLLCMFAAFRYVTRARIRYECGFVHCAWPTVFFLCPPERSLPGALASLVLYPARVLFFWGRRRPPNNRCSHTAWSRGSEQSWHRSWPYLIPSESPRCALGLIHSSRRHSTDEHRLRLYALDRSIDRYDASFRAEHLHPKQAYTHTIMSPELRRWSVALPKGSNAFAEAIGVPARKLLVEAAGVVADWEVELFF